MFSGLAVTREIKYLVMNIYVFVLGMSSVVSKSTIVTLSPSLHGIAFVTHNANVPRKVCRKEMGVARLLSNLSVLDVLLVDLSLVVVASLLNLVAKGVLGGGDTRANGGLAVLGDLLVDLLAGARGGTLDGLRDCVLGQQ
jgi:hypothetical protein